MNCNEANNYSIVEWLKLEGIAPTRVNRINHWYPSPFRNEKDPSFKVDSSKNVWYDFGMGAGGTLVDLICWLHNVEVRDALKIISGDKKKLTSSFFFQKQSESFRKGLEVVNVCNVNRRALVQYLKNRFIDPGLANQFVKEASILVGESKYFALAFKNDKGGYELRNKYFKGASSPKTITTIQGRKNVLNIFEGFMDFLSALTYYNIAKPHNTTIILNSLSHLDKIMEAIHSYETVNLYLDNDEAGKKAAVRIVKEHDNVLNQSNRIFPNDKDFNEYLLKRYGHDKNIHNSK